MHAYQYVYIHTYTQYVYIYIYTICVYIYACISNTRVAHLKYVQFCQLYLDKARGERKSKVASLKKQKEICIILLIKKISLLVD